MHSKWTRALTILAGLSLLAVLPACPPEGMGAQTYTAQDPFRNMVDMKTYFPMARGNYWRWESPDSGHLLQVYEDHSTAETEIWLMNSFSYTAYGVELNQYYMVWRLDYVVTLDKALEEKLPIVANPDTNIYLAPYVNIVFFRHLYKEDAIQLSHSGNQPYNHDLTYYSRLDILGGIDSVGCSPSEGYFSYIHPDNYPLPNDTKVVLGLTKGYCEGRDRAVGMRIYAKDIGLIQYGDMQLSACGLYDGTRIVEQQFNSNGFNW